MNEVDNSGEKIVSEIKNVNEIPEGSNIIYVDGIQDLSKITTNKMYITDSSGNIVHIANGKEEIEQMLENHSTFKKGLLSKKLKERINMYRHERSKS